MRSGKHNVQRREAAGTALKMSRKRQLLQEASGVTDTCTLSWDPFFEIRRFRNLAALPEEVRAS